MDEVGRTGGHAAHRRRDEAGGTSMDHRTRDRRRMGLATTAAVALLAVLALFPAAAAADTTTLTLVAAPSVIPYNGVSVLTGTLMNTTMIHGVGRRAVLVERAPAATGPWTTLAVITTLNGVPRVLHRDLHLDGDAGQDVLPYAFPGRAWSGRGGERGGVRDPQGVPEQTERTEDRQARTTLQGHVLHPAQAREGPQDRRPQSGSSAIRQASGSSSTDAGRRRRTSSTSPSSRSRRPSSGRAVGGSRRTRVPTRFTRPRTRASAA